MKRTFTVIALLVATLFSAATLSAQRTTRSRLKASAVTEKTSPKADFDTVATAADSLLFSFSGYEKTLRSPKETFFVTNSSDSTVNRLSLLITYKDMKGRVLDTREVTVNVDLAPGATRRVDLRSWDRQNVFYYHLSPMPRSSHATPYRVAIALVAAMRRR